jgi:hypothetical protein
LASAGDDIAHHDLDRDDLDLADQLLAHVEAADEVGGDADPAEQGEDMLGDTVVEHALAVDRALFLRVERGGVVLEILDQRAGFGTLIEDLCLAFVDLAAACHTRSCLVKNTAPRQTRIEWISGCRGCFTRRLNAKRFTVQ